MARLCERPGCSQTAEVMYGIDAEHLVVWIQSLEGPSPIALVVVSPARRCHGGATGLMLDDRREAVPRLFAAKLRHGSHALVGPARIATTLANSRCRREPARNERECRNPLPPRERCRQTTPSGLCRRRTVAVDGVRSTHDLDGLLTARPLLP
jgi:hypothetical protein